MAPSILWKSPPSSLILRENEVHLWRAFISILKPQLPKLQEILSDEEKEKATRFYFEKDRVRFSLGRGILRSLLGLYLRHDPMKTRFEQNPYGKPSLKDPISPLRFNLSHSGDLILLAFAIHHELGVDVERIREKVEDEKIAERYFSEEEKKILLGLSPDEKKEAFYTFWALKEAVLKAKGRGIAMGLDSFSVVWKPEREKAFLKIKDDPQEGERFTLLKFSPLPEYRGALAVENPEVKVHFYDWPENFKDFILLHRSSAFEAGKGKKAQG